MEIDTVVFWGEELREGFKSCIFAKEVSHVLSLHLWEYKMVFNIYKKMNEIKNKQYLFDQNDLTALDSSSSCVTLGTFRGLTEA